MIQLLALPRLRVFLLGWLVSLMGGRGLWLAVGLWAHQTTGQVGATGAVALAFLLGTLAAPLAGLVVDLVRRSVAVAVCDVAAAAAVVVLLVVGPAVSTGVARLWPVYVVMAVSGLCSAVAEPARTALIQALTPSELRTEAGSAVAVVGQTAGLLAPLLGVAVAAAAGLTVVVVAAVGGFLVEASVVTLLRVVEPSLFGHLRAASDGPRASRFGFELVAGVRQAFALPLLRDLLVAAAAAMAALALSRIVLLAVVGSVLGRPDTFLGVLVTVQGAAAVLAGLAAPRLLRRWGARRVAAAGIAGGAAGYLALLVPADLGPLMGSALIGTASTSLAAGITTVVLHEVPADVVGRVEALVGVVVSVAQTAGMAFAAAEVDAVGHRPLVALSVGLLAMALAVLVIGRITGQSDRSQIRAQETRR